MTTILTPEGAVLTGYALCLLVLLVYAACQLHLATLFVRARRGHGATPPPPPDPPHVTVQLPVYNERYVVARLLRAAGALRWPANRLEIQLLDDSTDDTSAIAATELDALRARGTHVVHLRRADRAGFKAGALREGLAAARGEYVAIFDADFVPAPDFLERTVPHLVADAALAAVQARWEHLNRTDSLTTRTEAFLLDLHFGLEQPARCRSGLFMNFNGTAGVWRRAAIEDSGGWSAATLTEDIDLSYRAQLRGWRLLYLDDLPCAGELPAEIGGVRSQQRRWMKGGAQNARLHLARVLRARHLPLRVRIGAAEHLLASTVYAAILLAALLTVPLAALVHTSIAVDYTPFAAVFSLSTVALVAVLHIAQGVRGTGLRGHVRFGSLVLLFLVFTMGLAVQNGRAALEGWLGRGGEFVRTPKAGTTDWTGGAYTRRTVDAAVALEVLVLTALAAGVVIGLRRHVHALLPLQAMVGAGLAWVIGLSLMHPLMARRHTTRPARTGTDAGAWRALGEEAG